MIKTMSLFIEIVASPLDLKTPPLEGRDEYQHLKNIQLRKKKAKRLEELYFPSCHIS